MKRVVVVDLLCNSPYYSGAFTGALLDAGVEAELASPRFYLEPDFLDAYPRSRWIVDLVTHANRPRTIRLAARTIEVILNGLQLLARIEMRRYDVVHVQWAPFDDRTSAFMRVLRAMCDRSQTLLVITAHNASPHDRGRVDLSTIRRNLNAAHLVVAHTQHVAAELTANVGIQAPIATIPHGPLFADHVLPGREESATRLGLVIAPTVLFLGLIRPYKGIDLLDEAWPLVLATVPNARLLVVGKVLGAGSKRDLDRLRTQPGVEVIDGYVSVERMLDCYATCDVVAFPYHKISQSGALMTAVGLGRPIVITPIAGLLEQVRTLTCAIVADDTSGPAIARALTSSLRRSAELEAAAGRDRAAIAHSSIGWNAVAAATIMAYQSRRLDIAAGGTA